MGYSTIVSHEYGHFIVNRLGRAQNAFGEGFGDNDRAPMVWDDRVQRPRWSSGQNTTGRDRPHRLQRAVPLLHGRPALFLRSWSSGGVWCAHPHTNMGNVYGSQPGLDATRNLNVKWRSSPWAVPTTRSTPPDPPRPSRSSTADDRRRQTSPTAPQLSSADLPGVSRTWHHCARDHQKPHATPTRRLHGAPILNVHDYQLFHKPLRGPEVPPPTVMPRPSPRAQRERLQLLPEQVRRRLPVNPKTS
jgi:hypothetical protein